MILIVLLSTILSPRLAILLWWLIDRDRWDAAYSSGLWPVLGFLILPWTTLVFVLVAPGGSVVGLDWIWLGFAVLVDLGAQGGGAFSGYRRRSRRYSRYA